MRWNTYIAKPKPTTYPVKFGRIYNRWIAERANTLTPVGWRLPSYNLDWNPLITYFGGSSNAGFHLNLRGLQWWNNDQVLADNSSGLNLKGNGRRSNGTSYLQFLSDSTFFIYASGTSGTLYFANSKSATGYVSIAATFPLNGCGIRIIREVSGIADGTTGQVVMNDGSILPTIVWLNKEWLAVNSIDTKLRDGTLMDLSNDSAQWTLNNHAIANAPNYDNSLI